MAGPIIWFISLFGFLSVLAGVLAFPNWDEGFGVWVNARGSAGVTDVALAVSWAGTFPYIVAIAGLVAVLIDRAFDTRWQTLAGVLTVLALDVVLVAGLKHLVARPRPAISERLASVSTSSFPSGHATATAAAATVLVLSVLAATQSRRTRWIACSAAAIAMLAMDWSRLALGVHFLSDVLAGSFLGIWLALSLAWTYRALARRHAAPVVSDSIGDREG